MESCSHDTNSLNFDKLEREIRCAVDSDEKYWRENDAKFRAVYQKVATYDEFRNIVAASHLKPLDKGEKLEFSTNQPWNSVATKDRLTGPVQVEENTKAHSKPPTNSTEFVRRWRQLKTNTSRLEFLRLIGPQTTGDVLRTEIPFGILGDIMSALLLAQATETDVMMDLLDRLSRAKRFDLSVQFLNKTEQNRRDELFVKLIQFVTQNEDYSEQREVLLKQLLELYGASATC